MNVFPELIPAFENREQLIPLYEEYADMLVKTDPVFSRSLEQQNYDEEIARLEEKYGLPKGRIYLVYVDGSLAGCVGMKPSDLVEQLVRRIMDDARGEGYAFLRLDTLPGLKSALKLYRRLGFYEVAPYYDCLVPGTIFLEIAL